MLFWIIRPDKSQPTLFIFEGSYSSHKNENIQKYYLYLLFIVFSLNEKNMK